MRTPNTQVRAQVMDQRNLTNGQMNYSSQISYHEMADIPVREMDVLEQLDANLKQLSDLQARMNFMMREIRYLMKI